MLDSISTKAPPCLKKRGLENFKNNKAYETHVIRKVKMKSFRMDSTNLFYNVI